MRSQPPISVGLQNMRNPAFKYSQSGHVTASIADWIHAEGLPFNTAESSRFKAMIHKARLVGDDYKPPNRKLVATELLDINYNKILDKNINNLATQKKFGFLAMGDGATIHRMPLVNELWQAGDVPPTVIGIHDCTDHMAEGGKKDAPYIANLFETMADTLDKDNAEGKLDCIFMDGASNVQKAGRILNERYPTSHTLHGIEHVFSLLFDDISKLKPVKVSLV